ncbi:chordin isoform X2 [Ambystoma mexicanum]|uniref:chordin isoform X2 n=1 Tax=Ambystoma mexicanum TaxID=8296 RepID=UPI0037E85902
MFPEFLPSCGTFSAMMEFGERKKKPESSILVGNRSCMRSGLRSPISALWQPFHACCSFGGRFHALEDSWHPDLGEPFGVMHCVVCYCEPQRNRRGKAVGKVSCKNIKQDCPTPACAHSILLPGQCCRTCPKVSHTTNEKKTDLNYDGFEYFQEKDDDLHKTYNDRSYLSSEDVSQDDSRVEFVALLTSPLQSWLPVSSGVAKARFTLLRSSLLFSISYERLGRPIRVRFTDLDGTVLFEHPVNRMAAPQANMICGMWRNAHKSSLHMLKTAQIHVSLVMASRSEGEIRGRIIKHRALFAETFSAILTPEDPELPGLGGIAMMTLSDVEDNLHFILMSKGLLDRAGKGRAMIPVQLRILHQNHVLREMNANITAQDQDFAEVVLDLSTREMYLLAHGQLQITLETQGKQSHRISGYITGKKTCDTIQSVLSGGDALSATKTGAVGSAKFTLHANGTLEYQVQVAATETEVVGITLETKPRRKTRRTVLHDMTGDYSNGLASGVWEQMNARDLHMLLQSELFINVATQEFEEGELRGQITSLPYSGLWARYQELPIPLAGQFVIPPIRTASAGHAWISLDEHCHLHYEIVVTGLGKPDDATLNVHLHGFAEIGETRDNSQEHKRLLKGFYGSEAQGIVKDLDKELLSHLAKGSAFIQVSTKVNPRGEIRGRVHIPNSCESGRLTVSPEDPEYEYEGLEDGKQRDPEDIKKDPQSCFFEGQTRAHGSRWAPEYDKKCSVCSCQKRTVICDPIICQPLNCTQVVHLEGRCCPICKEIKEVKIEVKPTATNEGCYFDGDKSWRAAGTRWHPVVPPFGLIKCAICTCKGSTGEVHCEKVQCPRLTCANPVRVAPADCCKQCPVVETSPFELSEMMQSDGPRACKFGRHWYPNNESWHPTVPPFGEMKCITCWCVNGVPQCRRQECTAATCATNNKNRCCSKCRDSSVDDESDKLREDVRRPTWSS